MENENRIIQLNELNKELRIKKFTLQKKKTNFAFAIVAILAMITFHNLPVFIFGGLVLALFAINTFWVKDRVILDMYQEYFVVPDVSNQTIGYKIGYDEVLDYSYDNEQWGGMVFVIRLKDDTVFAIPSDNQSIIAEFKKIIPNAEKYTKFKNDMAERRAKRKKERKH